jgi:hypothetical protein
MELHLGRLLQPGEVVHHKDGNKQNNTLENLQVFERNADHLQHELTGRVPKWTEDGKRRILEATRKPHGPLSEETRKKMSIAHKLRKRMPHSPETRERQRQAAFRRGERKRQASLAEQESGDEASPLFDGQI